MEARAQLQGIPKEEETESGVTMKGKEITLEATDAAARAAALAGPEATSRTPSSEALGTPCTSKNTWGDLKYLFMMAGGEH